MSSILSSNGEALINAEAFVVRLENLTTTKNCKSIVKDYREQDLSFGKTGCLALLS